MKDAAGAGMVRAVARKKLARDERSKGSSHHAQCTRHDPHHDDAPKMKGRVPHLPHGTTVTITITIATSLPHQQPRRRPAPMMTDDSKATKNELETLQRLKLSGMFFLLVFYKFY
jgi:hypothetical protein